MITRGIGHLKKTAASDILPRLNKSLNRYQKQPS